MLTLGKSDGDLFILVKHYLLSDIDDKNLLCATSAHGERSFSGKRREQSRRKATEVMLKLIQMVQRAELSTDIVTNDLTLKKFTAKTVSAAAILNTSFL